MGNLKGFSESVQGLSLRPLTLLFGPNSGGKSTLLQALAFFHEAIHRGHPDVSRPHIAKGAVDLGGIQQLIHRADLRRELIIGVTMEAGPYLQTLALHPSLNIPEGTRTHDTFSTIGIRLQIGVASGSKGGRTRPELLGFDLEVDSSLVARFRRRKASLWADTMNWQHPFITLLLIRGSQEVQVKIFDKERADEDIASFLRTARSRELFPEYQHLVSPFLPAGIRIRKAPPQSGIGYAIAQIFRRPLDRLLRAVNQGITNEFKRFYYIGPTRAVPPRFERVEEHGADDQLELGDAWSAAAQHPATLESINRWLGAENRLRTPYRLSLEPVFSDQDIEAASKDLAERQRFSSAHLLEYLRKHHPSRGYEVRLTEGLTGTSVSPKDVGYGLSQVLPVLVTCYGAQGALIAIEQPELHLHPALQAELGDALIESALVRKNTLVLETHSEHLLLRILRRVRESAAGMNNDGVPIGPDDISIAYVSPSAEGTRVTPLPVTAEGDFASPWPEGFFTERIRELM